MYAQVDADQPPATSRKIRVSHTPYLSRPTTVPNIKGAAPSGRRLPPYIISFSLSPKPLLPLYQRSLILIQNDPLNMISGSGIDGMCNIPILSV